MEPFKLTLSQVNFEGQELSTSQDLNSFSNLFSCDSNFTASDPDGLPPVTSKVVSYTKPEPRQENNLESQPKIPFVPPSGDAVYYYDTDWQYNKQPPEGASVEDLGSDIVDKFSADEPAKVEKINDNSQLHLILKKTAASLPKGEPSPDVSVKSSQSMEEERDSFTAFTETVEALALQKSVIGHKGIVPASAEEIAQAIAETQRQLGIKPSIEEDLAPVHHGRHSPVEFCNPSSKEIAPAESEDFPIKEKVANISGHSSNYIERSTSRTEHNAYNSVDLNVKETKTQYYDFIHQKVVSENDVSIDDRNSAHVKLKDTIVENHSLNVDTQHNGPNVTESQISDDVRPPTNPETSLDTQAHKTAENVHHHKRTESLDSTKSKESIVSTDSSMSKEKIRIIPSEITKEKTTWFSGVGPPLETEKPKHLEDEEISNISDTPASVSAEPSNVSQAHVDTVDSSIHITPDHADITHDDKHDGISVEGVFHSMAVNSKEEVVYESQVVVTQTDGVVTSSEEAEKCVTENGGMEVTLEEHQPDIDISENVIAAKAENQSNTNILDNVTVTKKEHHPDAGVSENMAVREAENQSDTVTTSTPLRLATSDLEKPLVSPLTAPSSAYPSNKLPLFTGQHGNLVRDFSGSNLSVSDSVNEVRSRASSVSSISMLDLLQTDSPKDSISMVAYDCIKEELERCMREKAQLEGQNEVLQVEAKTAIKERAELQSQVAGLITQLKADESMHKSVTEERNSLAVDLDILKQKRGMLEQVIIDSHKLLEEKNIDLKTVQEDLQLSREARKKLEEEVKDVSQEIKAKEGTVTALKNKVAELYVDYQSTNQAKIYAENELKAALSDITSLNSAKDWFEKQIKFLQESNSGLQNELTKMQGQSIAQSTLIEKLKADNVRMRQHQSDLQQKALLDKELLAKQLESIEADILQRESMFIELQKEKDALELELNTRPEKAQLLGDSQGNAEENDKLVKETKRKDAQINVMSREQKELVKRLTLAQESILERDKALDNLERRYVGVETQLSKIQSEMLAKEEDHLALKEERNVMEVSLTAAKEEKLVIDNALQAVKADMGKVEKAFKKMKLDLTNKNTELEESTIEKGKLQVEVDSLQEQLERAVATRAEGTTKTQSLSDEEKIRLAENSHLVFDLRMKIGIMETTIKNFKHELSLSETTKKAAIADKSSLEEELHVFRDRISEYEEKVKSIQEEKSGLEKQIEVTALSNDESVRLKEEIASLQNKLADLQKESHREIAKQKGKALKLGSDLGRTQKEYKKKSQIFESDVQRLDKELVEARETVSRRTAELQRLEERFTLEVDEQREHLTKELVELRGEFEFVQTVKNKIESELELTKVSLKGDKEKYKSKLERLEKELEAVKNYKEKQDMVEENKKQLALDLEKERGKYTGILQSHSALKEHAHVLEEALAMRESSVQEMSSHVQGDFIRRDKMISDLKDKVKVSEEQLSKEKQAVKDSKKQLMTEKGSHIKLKRQHQDLAACHDKLQLDFEKSSTELELMKLDVDKSQQTENQYKTHLDKVTLDYKEMKVNYEELKREAMERSIKDPHIEEQIKTLRWQIEQKSTELEAAHQQLALAEDRQNLEVENLRQTLQMTSGDLTSLRMEMSGVKQEKMLLQSKVTELKGALKSSITHLRSITSEAKDLGPQFDLSALERLLQDTPASPSKSKPLSFLQATLSGLRGEISTLQKQVDDHTIAVQSSSSSWRELEDQVKALREVCQTSTTDRQALTVEEIVANDQTQISIEQSQRLTAATPPGGQILNQESPDLQHANEGIETTPPVGEKVNPESADIQNGQIACDDISEQTAAQCILPKKNEEILDI